MGLRVSEIFHSVQGEGLLLGVPSTFIRLSGCNLRCVWCDTPYASWRPEGPVVEVSQIVQEIESVGISHVVLTGGEPMIFDGAGDLCGELRAAGKHITIETAGTVFREWECDLMSISPKLSHSTPIDDPNWASRHEATRLNFEALSSLIESYECQLKFVVAQSSDIQEIQEILAQLPLVSPDRICLMPEGRDSNILWQRAKELVPIAMEHGWRIAPRIQIDLFGDTRGT